MICFIMRSFKIDFIFIYFVNFFSHTNIIKIFNMILNRSINYKYFKYSILNCIIWYEISLASLNPVNLLLIFCINFVCVRVERIFRHS